MSRTEIALSLWNKRVADLSEAKASELRDKLTWPSTPMDARVAENLLYQAVADGRLSPREMAPMLNILVHWRETKLHERLTLYNLVLELMANPARYPKFAGLPVVLT